MNFASPQKLLSYALCPRARHRSRRQIYTGFQVALLDHSPGDRIAAIQRASWIVA
jgi:hypothetical protein